MQIKRRDGCRRTFRQLGLFIHLKPSVNVYRSGSSLAGVTMQIKRGDGYPRTFLILVYIFIWSPPFLFTVAGLLHAVTSSLTHDRFIFLEILRMSTPTGVVLVVVLFQSLFVQGLRRSFFSFLLSFRVLVEYVSPWTVSWHAFSFGRCAVLPLGLERLLVMDLDPHLSCPVKWVDVYLF